MFVWSTRYSPVFLCVCPALSCLVWIKDYIFEFNPRLRVPRSSLLCAPWQKTRPKQRVSGAHCPGHRLWLSQAAPKSSSLGRYEVSPPIVALSSPPATAHSSLPVDHQSRSPAACQSSSTAATKLSPPIVAHSSLPVDHQSSLSADHLKSSLPAAPTSGPLAAAHFSSRVSSSIVTARSAVPGSRGISSLVTARSAVPDSRRSSSVVTARSAVPGSRGSSSLVRPGVPF